MNRLQFERVVKNKTIIGEPFTLEDVAEVMRCSHPILPACDCPVPYVPSSWMTEMVKGGQVRKLGEIRSSKPAAKGRKISQYVGSNYRPDED